MAKKKSIRKKYEGEDKKYAPKNATKKPDITRNEYALTLIRLVKNGKWGLQDKSKKVVIQPMYDDIGFFELILTENNEHVALCRAELGDKKGFIDLDNNIVAPIKYDYVDGMFEYGLDRVGLNGKYGFINAKAEECIPLKYDMANWFVEGFAEVGVGVFGKNGKHKIGFINNKGKEITLIKYEGTSPFHGGFASAQLKGKWGAIDITGKEVIPFIYENSIRFENGTAQVTLNDRTFFIDTKGNETMVCETCTADTESKNEEHMKLLDQEYDKANARYTKTYECLHCGLRWIKKENGWYTAKKRIENGNSYWTDKI